ncbi:hypothetical protein [Virgibacillus sp. SK37]|uniref:hypothetical protein n=1 Tax=Virgibacillus sp. SK37 TaxID=403957 RepID=UPI0004D1E1B4|nr:hypothetical protein [Virgibacillus sp. SK37]AIF45639.1 hypothetical protein X953_18785 [Virgibacillus sp. SK37]
MAYSRTRWNERTAITADRLNNLEEGVEEAIHKAAKVDLRTSDPDPTLSSNQGYLYIRTDLKGGGSSGGSGGTGETGSFSAKFNNIDRPNLTVSFFYEYSGDLSKVEIYRDNSLIDTQTSGFNSGYTDTVSTAKTYTYRFVGLNSNGNQIGESTVDSVKFNI